MTKYPDDADGAVLSNMAADGVDMTQPLELEFPVVAPNEQAANSIQNAIAQAGYQSEIVFDDGEPDEDGLIDPDDEEFGPTWDVYAKITMAPEYNEIIRIQAELSQLAAPFGGECDGWGAMLP
jgi:hypothetical protein